MLRDGQVAEQGTHEQLMAIMGGVYRHLWEAQLTESTQVVAQEGAEVVNASGSKITK